MAAPGDAPPPVPPAQDPTPQEIEHEPTRSRDPMPHTRRQRPVVPPGGDGMSGLRHRRSGYFVQIPREAIRDKRLGWKERGLLGFILDMPPGWKPTIEKLVVASNDDGPTATASGVMNLRRYGYYRLERRRRLDGTFEWGAAVSEVAVPSWATEHALFDGKAIPLIEQPDGTFKVRMPDGSLADDGFEGVSDRDDEPPGPDASPQVRPEAGFPVVDEPLMDEPLVDQPQQENLRPKSKELTTREPSSLRDEGASCGNALPGMGLAVPEQEPTLNQRVDSLVRAWWDWRKANRPHTLPTQGVPAIKGMVKTALQNGKPERLVGQAMSRLADQALPFSGGTLQTAIKEVALLPDSPPEWRVFAGADGATNGGAVTQRRGPMTQEEKDRMITVGRQLDQAAQRGGGAW